MTPGVRYSESYSILVTGAAGFIGMHVALKLLELGYNVIGVDNLNTYYDVNLKKTRLRVLSKKFVGFKFIRADLSEKYTYEVLLAPYRFTHVVHLAAQAGVRHSLTNPHEYIMSNIVSFANIIEYCKNIKTEHFLYASSSSVYGDNQLMPFREEHQVNHPVSLYAATKKSNELIAHTYSHLYGMPTTGMRFFTVYGPWGRPDMAPMLFADAISKNRPIELFNNGEMLRDFTFIDDVVDAVVALVPRPSKPNPSFDRLQPDAGSSPSPYSIYNVGNQKPVELNRFISLLEDALGKKAIRVLRPMQPGDVTATHADVSKLSNAIEWFPRTPLEEGVARFAHWFTYFSQNTTPSAQFVEKRSITSFN